MEVDVLRRRILALLTAAMAVLGVVVVQGPAVADRGYPFTFIELGSSWSYRRVAHGKLPGFENGDDADHSFEEADAGCEVRSFKLTTSAFEPGFNTIAVRAAGDGPTDYVDLQVVGKIFYEQG